MPRVRFKVMSLEENIENIKWMFFDTNGEFSIRDAVVQYFPDLKESVNLTSKQEVYIRLLWISRKSMMTFIYDFFTFVCLIEQKGIEINWVKVKLNDQIIIENNKEIIIKKGNKTFLKVIIFY